MNHGQHSNLQSAIVGNTVDNSLQRREGRKEPFFAKGQGQDKRPERSSRNREEVLGNLACHW